MLEFIFVSLGIANLLLVLIILAWLVAVLVAITFIGSAIMVIAICHLAKNQKHLYQ